MRYIVSVIVLALFITANAHAGKKKKGLFKDKGPCASKLLPHMTLPEVGDCLMTRDADEWNRAFFKAVKKDVRDAKKHHDHGIAWVKEAEEVGGYLNELDKLANLQLQAHPGHTPPEIQHHLDDAINALVADEEDESIQEDDWSEKHGFDIWKDDIGVADLGPTGLEKVEGDGIDSLEELFAAEEHAEKHSSHHASDQDAEKWGKTAHEIEHNKSVQEKYIAEWAEYLGTVHKFKEHGRKRKIKTRDIAVVVNTDPKDGFALVKVFASVNPKDHGLMAKIYTDHNTPTLKAGESVIFFNKMSEATKPITEHGHKVTHIVAADTWFVFTPEAYEKLHPQVMHRRHH